MMLIIGLQEGLVERLVRLTMVIGKDLQSKSWDFRVALNEFLRAVLSAICVAMAD